MREVRVLCGLAFEITGHVLVPKETISIAANSIFLISVSALVLKTCPFSFSPSLDPVLVFMI